jgi:hypothetical protein
MLADMSSLTALAYANHITSQASYTTFFATVATIIPVLFIATALQGSTAYQALLKGNFSEGNMYPGLIAMAILISGGGGELVAVYALYDQSIAAATAGWILAATFILTLAAVAGPAVAFWRFMGGGRSGGRGLLDPIPPKTDGTVSLETDGTGTQASSTASARDQTASGHEQQPNGQ